MEIFVCSYSVSHKFKLKISRYSLCAESCQGKIQQLEQVSIHFSFRYHIESVACDPGLGATYLGFHANIFFFNQTRENSDSDNIATIDQIVVLPTIQLIQKVAFNLKLLSLVILPLHRIPNSTTLLRVNLIKMLESGHA